MKVSVARRLLQLYCLVVVLGSVWLIHHELTARIELPEIHVSRNHEIDAAPQRKLWSHPDTASFAIVADKQLRRVLYDPPPPEPTPKPPPSSLSVQLIGTALENDRSFAMLRFSDRRIRFLAAGQHFQDANRDVELVEVNEDSVTVRYEGITTTLRKESRR